MAPATESDGSSSDLNESWERPVWYQLVDVQRNKLGSVGRVKVSSDDALIVDFLDEVEKKNKRGRLNGIVVIDLAVYDSIDATSPMKARDTIGSHGKTDSTALIVVVPSPTQLSPQPPLPLTLQPRKEQLVVGGEAFSVVEGMTVNPNKLTAFWTALAKLSSGLEYGTVIELPSGIYILGDQTRGSRVFVRDCYKETFGRLQGENSREVFASCDAREPRDRQDVFRVCAFARVCTNTQDGRVPEYRRRTDFVFS